MASSPSRWSSSPPTSPPSQIRSGEPPSPPTVVISLGRARARVEVAWLAKARSCPLANHPSSPMVPPPSYNVDLCACVVKVRFGSGLNLRGGSLPAPLWSRRPRTCVLQRPWPVSVPYWCISGPGRCVPFQCLRLAGVLAATPPAARICVPFQLWLAGGAGHQPTDRAGFLPRCHLDRIHRRGMSFLKLVFFRRQVQPHQSNQSRLPYPRLHYQWIWD